MEAQTTEARTTTRLQVQFQKRMTYGLEVNANYTWSHFLDDQDSSGWGSRGGNTPWQIGYEPSANYGPSNFDITNMFKARRDLGVAGRQRT